MEEQKDLYIGQHTRPEEKKYKEWDTLGFNDKQFASVVKDYILKKVYKRLNEDKS